MEVAVAVEDLIGDDVVDCYVGVDAEPVGRLYGLSGAHQSH